MHEKLLAWLVLLLTLIACSPQISGDGVPDTAIHTDVSPSTMMNPTNAALPEPTEEIDPTALSIPPTFTPLPTMLPGPPPPTSTPLPTETLTSTPVPTVIPPTPEIAGGPLPNGWFAFSQTIQVIPDDPSPSAYGCHLILRRIGDTEERDLTPESTNCVRAQALSPDGQQVAYISGYIRNLSAGLGGDLLVTRIDGAGTIQLMPRVSSPTWIVWSKDGAQIANYFYGDFKWHVYDVIEGSPEVAALDALTPDVWILPNLSPDGQYRASFCEVDLLTSVRRLCITALADDPRPLGSINLDAGIFWTPDGAWIVYPAEDGTYAAHPDGSGTMWITEHWGAWWFGE